MALNYSGMTLDELSKLSSQGDMNARMEGGRRKGLSSDVNEQMDAYNRQSEITQQEIANTRAQEDYQKRRIEEKQIRALRAGHRGLGISVGGSVNSDLGGGADKLGG